MDKISKLTLSAAKSYTNKSLEGGGAVAGKPCQIQSITDITGGKRITFIWYLNDGTTQTSTMDVMNGVDGTDGQNGTDGVSVVGASIGDENHLILTMSDGNEIDCGEVPTVQGEQGIQGEPGADGFTPTILVKTSTSDTYILTITNASGSFDTPNLKGGGSGSASAMSELTDVVLTNLSDGQILKYNLATQKWYNTDDIPIDSLGSIPDVQLTSVQNGQTIAWDSVNSKWVNVDLTNPTQFSSMPTASEHAQAVVQYVGTDTVSYRRGFFYYSEPSIVSGEVVYTWVQIDVQPSNNNYNDLSNKPEINGVEISGQKSLDDLGINGKFQYSELPTASAANVSKICQYTGATTVSLKTNFFYQVRYDDDSGTYKWVQIDVSSNKSLEDAITALQSDLGDMSQCEIGGVSDVVSALNALNKKEVQTITYTEPNLVITYKNGDVVNFDVRTILVDLQIGELANVLDTSIQNTNVLQYDSSISKYKPYDIVAALTTLLTTAETYTDNRIASSIQQDAFLCDAKPTLYHDTTTGDDYVIYIQDGTTKTTTNTDARFYYEDSNNIPYCTSWIDGAEFTYVVSAANWQDYVNKNTDVTSTYTTDMVDKTKIPNVSALDALLAIVNTSLALKVNIADIVDSLISQDATKPLSAKQGYELKALVDAKQDKMQYSSLPTADASLSGIVLQYTATTSGSYKKGSFYTCKYDNDNDEWYWDEIAFAPDMVALTAAQVDVMWE